jgi:hypothetical protein
MILKITTQELNENNLNGELFKDGSEKNRSIDAGVFVGL